MGRREYDLDELRELMLQWRAIEPGDECEECGGSGIRCYGSTATWHGGIGGSAMTNDVCDHCWGSGDRHRPWPNRRRGET
jgi:hypothetical protein